MSELLLLGTSYKTAPVALREKVALTSTGIERLLGELREVAAVQEAVVLSTCNRTELYLVSDDPVAAETAVIASLARRAGLRPTELLDGVYALRNCDAARQLFRVTSGLESMIIGEAEVQGQVRSAYEIALAGGSTGPLTNRLFRAAIETGKRVRTQTQVGAGRRSVASVAVELARDTVGELPDRHVLIIGAGETSELVAQALDASGASTLFVANRRRERAETLAARFHGSTVSFDALPEQLELADIVIASTSSPHPLIEADVLADVVQARAGRPLLLVDLAVPRDIESACAGLDGVTLVNVDDLHAVVARHADVRLGEAEAAEAVVEDEIERFAAWLGSLEVMPTVAALRNRASTIVDAVVAENAGRWETASDRDRERVEAIARAVANRLLHEPTVRMKAAEGGERHARMHVLRELFGLVDETPAAGDAPADVTPLTGRRRAS